MDVKDIKRLLEAIAASEVSELTLETGDYKLAVKRGSSLITEFAGPLPIQRAVAPGEVAAQRAQPTQAEVEAESAAEPAPEESRFVEVIAPIVGTFYTAPAPDAEPYVRVGDKVKAGTVLCIIEAMKLMNEIEAESSGTVAEVLVRNEEPVEYGQVLFRIDPG